MQTIQERQAKWLTKAKEIHGDKYDYSKTKYTGLHNKVTIICPIHGKFNQRAFSHTVQKCGCRQCAQQANSRKQHNGYYNSENFIKEAKRVHGDKYDYSLIKLDQWYNKYPIKCLKHGVFEQEWRAHVTAKHNCPSCAKDARKKWIKDNVSLTTKEVITTLKSMYKDLLKYDRVEYTNVKTPIMLYCTKHNLWFIERYANLLRYIYCPQCCKNPSKGERILNILLDRHRITYIQEYRIPGYKYRYDFYLPNINLLIEYDGAHHFKPIWKYGGEDHLVQVKKRDKIKDKLASDHGYLLFRFDHTVVKDLAEVFCIKLYQYYQYYYKGKFYKDYKELAKDVNKSWNYVLENYKKYETKNLYLY